MNNFEWNDFDTAEIQEKDSIITPIEEEVEPFQWDTFNSVEDESFDLPRQVARTGSRIAETIFGLPAEIRNFGNSLVESIVPPLASDIRALMGKDRLTSKQKKEIQNKIENEKNILQKGLDNLPTSEQLKEFSSNITSGFTDPQNAQEEFADDIVSLGTSLLIGQKDPTKFRNLAKATGMAIGAKGVGKTIDLLGGTPREETAGEVGSLFIMNLLSKRGFANKFVSEKYNRAREYIPKNTMIETGNLDSKLNNLKKTLKTGLPKTSPVKNEVLKTIDELGEKIAGGALPVEDLVQSYHDINDKLLSKDLFDNLKKAGKVKLRRQYDSVKKVIDSELAEYGKDNPPFYKEWKEANRAKAVLASSENAKDFVLSNMKTLPGHLATGMAIKLFMGAPALTAAGGGFAAYQTGKILNRIAKDPSLRKYYTQAIGAATKENMPAFVNSLNRLEKELKKKEDFILQDEM